MNEKDKAPAEVYHRDTRCECGIELYVHVENLGYMAERTDCKIFRPVNAIRTPEHRSKP